VDTTTAPHKAEAPRPENPSYAPWDYPEVRTTQAARPLRRLTSPSIPRGLPRFRPRPLWLAAPTGPPRSRAPRRNPAHCLAHRVGHRVGRSDVIRLAPPAISADYQPPGADTRRGTAPSSSPQCRPREEFRARPPPRI